MKKDEEKVVEEKAQEANEGVGETIEPPKEVESADDDQFKGFEPDEEVK